jgi:predicted transposase YdaD
VGSSILPPQGPLGYSLPMAAETTSHDESYKQLFSHPEMVESLLRDFVPEDWVAELDFATLERQNGSYVSDDLRERHDDVIWRVKFRGQWFYVYLLLEFQSTVDPWMALRIMVYVGLLYQDLIKSGEVGAGDPLPPVFPLVLHRGSTPWSARLDVAELIVPASPGLARYRPSLKYFLVDAVRLGPEDLSKESPAAHLLRLETSPAPADLLAAMRSLKEQLRGPQYSSLRRAFTVWIRRVLMPRMNPPAPIPEMDDNLEEAVMLAERITQWTEQAKNEGILQGRMEGRREGESFGLLRGKLEGQAAILQRLLLRRFGQQLAEERFREKLHNAQPEQLETWAERILDAQSLDDVFREED